MPGGVRGCGGNPAAYSINNMGAVNFGVKVDRVSSNSYFPRNRTLPVESSR